jgi:splicing factor 3A subunit 2
MQPGLLFQIYYPQIVNNEIPHFRFMSSYEQRIEPPSKFYQYLLVAAEPYDTIAFKVQSKEVDRGKNGGGEDRLWSWWDADTKLYHLQFFFKDIK